LPTVCIESSFFFCCLHFQVLITTSSLLLPPRSFPSLWPEYCHLTGFVSNKIPLQRNVFEVYSLLSTWIVRQNKIVCVDFGSMTEVLYQLYGTASLVLFLTSILSFSQGFSVIFICHRYCQLFQEAFQSYSENHISDCSSFQSRVIWIAGEMNHEFFLSSCYLFIHHGGIGTSNLAFSLEIPQGNKICSYFLFMFLFWYLCSDSPFYV
jgi:hypothetical protein